MTGAISEQGNHSVVGGDDELESIGKKLGFQNGIRDGVGRAAVELFLEDFEDDALGHVPDYELALVVPDDEDISEGRVGLDQENVRVHFDFAVVFVDLKNYISKKKIFLIQKKQSLTFAIKLIFALLTYSYIKRVLFTNPSSPELPSLFFSTLTATIQNCEL